MYLSPRPSSKPVVFTAAHATQQSGTSPSGPQQDIPLVELHARLISRPFSFRAYFVMPASREAPLLVDSVSPRRPKSEGPGQRGSCLWGSRRVGVASELGRHTYMCWPAPLVLHRDLATMGLKKSSAYKLQRSSYSQVKTQVEWFHLLVVKPSMASPSFPNPIVTN